MDPAHSGLAPWAGPFLECAGANSLCLRSPRGLEAVCFELLVDVPVSIIAADQFIRTYIRLRVLTEGESLGAGQTQHEAVVHVVVQRPMQQGASCRS